MEMVYREIVFEMLEDLTQDEYERFKYLLSNECMNEKIIPAGKLEGASKVRVTKMLFAYHSIDCLQLFLKVLNDIPRKDLAEDFSQKVEAEKKKSEDQIVKTDGSPSEDKS